MIAVTSMLTMSGTPKNERMETVSPGNVDHALFRVSEIPKSSIIDFETSQAKDIDQIVNLIEDTVKYSTNNANESTKKS